MPSKITTLFSDYFQKEKIIYTTARLETYDIPTDAFLGTRLDMVEFSRNGIENNYYKLKIGSTSERASGNYSDPIFYIRRSKQILLQPTPDVSNGYLRLTYQKALPKLDKRRATVLSVTLDTSTKTITSLTFDPTVEIDVDALTEQNYFTIVDKNGSIKMRSIPVSSIDQTTGVVTLDAGFVYEDGESISAGDFACRGIESSTHSQLMESAERYIIAYMAWKIFKRDGSQDSLEQEKEMLMIEQDIIDATSEPQGDPSGIVILDSQYLNYAGD